MKKIIISLIESLFEFIESFYPLLIGLVSILGLFAGIILLGYGINETACYSKWEPARQPQFSMSAGCTVLTESGERVSQDFIRVMP